jgi:RNA polymerase sigma factor (sigma-70 family)
MVDRRTHTVLAAAEILLRNHEERTDGDLLRDFLKTKAQDAFASLVWRHGPMVSGVCRRILGNADDADDALQATFLVLATKANSLKARSTLGDWLHEVARRIALNARRYGTRRRQMERQIMPPHRPGNHDPGNHDIAEMLPILDEELARLPEKYRSPIVLCDLEGQSRKSAARQLGWPEGSVAGRLARGRQLLARRLTKRGVALTASALAITLSSKAAAASVPTFTPQLAQAAADILTSGSLAGSKIVSAKVLALTHGALKTMFLSKLKAMTTVAIVSLTLAWGIGALVAGSIAAQSAQARNDAAQEVHKRNVEKAAVAAADLPEDEPKQTPARKDEPAVLPDDKPGTVTIRGRVLDADGKAVAHADVAVVGRVENLPRQKWAPPSLAEGKADQQGRFRIELPRRATDYIGVHVGATAAGLAMGTRQLEADSWQTEVQLRLQPEQALRGQLLDLQGLPVAGARVDVSGLVDRADQSYALSGFTTGIFAKYWNPERKLERWRKSATTDAQGQFVLHGLRADWYVELKVNDERFGPQEFRVSPGSDTENKGFVGVLAPKRILEGMVTSASDGKAVPGAELHIGTRPSEVDLNPGYYVESRADAHGRFAAALSTGKRIEVTAHAPPGSAHLGLSKSMDWPNSGVLKQEMSLALPQGLLVRGTVTEAPSGKPIAGATVEYHPNWDDNPLYRRDLITKKAVSGADGKFEMSVPPGRGHLLINGPTLDYLHEEISTQSLYGAGIYPNRRNYYDAIVPVQLKPQASAHETSVKLRRGVTLTGSLIGPEGQPVPEAIMLCRSYLGDYQDWNATHTKRVPGGRFALPGCDPERSAEVFFVDEKNRWAGIAKLSGKDSGKPMPVRLERSGSVSVRLIDEKGNPIPKFDTWVYFVITPGADIRLEDRELIDPATGQMLVPAEMACAPYSTCRGSTDSEGRITFHCLIPGATYQLGGQSSITGGSRSLRDGIRVVPGQLLDLGDIQVKPAKR